MMVGRPCDDQQNPAYDQLVFRSSSLSQLLTTLAITKRPEKRLVYPGARARSVLFLKIWCKVGFGFHFVDHLERIQRSQIVGIQRFDLF